MFKKYLKTGLCIYVAFVFVQSLFFKFTGSPETEYIFGTLGKWSGIELFGLYGAYAVGITELIASILLFTPFRLFGALMAAGTMSGAIFFHLFTPLGINMPEFDASGTIIGDDGGLLFINACVVFLAAVAVLVLEFRDRNNS